MTPITLHDLLRDEKLRRHEFPVCEKKIFLAHAGVSPLPRRVTEAMQRYLDAAARHDQEETLPERIIGETRQLAGKLIGANAEEMAFVGSTSMGLAMVATGLTWQNGDNLVYYSDGYPANVYPVDGFGKARRGNPIRRAKAVRRCDSRRLGTNRGWSDAACRTGQYSLFVRLAVVRGSNRLVSQEERGLVLSLWHSKFWCVTHDRAARELCGGGRA